MMPLRLRVVRPGTSEESIDRLPANGWQLQSLLVCPVRSGAGAVPSTASSPPEEDVRERTTFEILPGHQPLCAVLPPGAHLYAIFSGNDLPTQGSQSHYQATVAPAGGVLHVSTTTDATIATIVLFGE
jgi:hypothetical protein